MSNVASYKMIRPIGRKLYYKIYEVKHIQKGRNYYLKLLDKELCEKEETRTSLLNSIRMLISSPYPGTFRVYDAGVSPRGVYIVSDVVQGRAIADLNMVSYEKVSLIVRTIADVLRHYHSNGLIHGLLNPYSVYITPQNVLKVDDFGLYPVARELVNRDHPNYRNCFPYFAPELLLGGGDVDARVDVFSLGTVLYELLSGAPYVNENSLHAIREFYLAGGAPIALSEVRQELSREMDYFVAKCLRPNPENRTINMREFKQGLKFTDKALVSPKFQLPGFKPNEKARNYTARTILALIIIFFLTIILFPNFQMILNREDFRNFFESEQARDDAEPGWTAAEPVAIDSFSAPQTVEAKPDDSMIADSYFNTYSPLSDSSINPADNSPPATNLENDGGESPPAEFDVAPNIVVIVSDSDNRVNADIFVNNLYRGRTDSDGELIIGGLETKRLYRITAIKYGKSETKEIYLTKNAGARVLAFNLR